MTASSIPARPIYLNQLARARRFLQRIEQRTAPDQATMLVRLNDYQDALWSFFKDCWHVKDWIQNDQVLPEALRDAVVRDVHASRVLLVCRSIANAAKHLTLTGRKGRKVKAARVETFIINPNLEDGSVSWDYMVKLEDGTWVTAYEIGVEAMREWERSSRTTGCRPCHLCTENWSAPRWSHL